LCESKDELGHLKVKSKGWKAIEPGLKRIYCNGREALETAHREPSEENFHEWRKRVKDLWYQLRMLCPANPRELRERVTGLEELANLLGDGHDLFMLNEFVGKKLLQSEHAKMLKELIRKRQEKLHSKALKLGGRFYRQKPNEFCRHIEDYWKTWRKT
jgi:CHAD domain-containing protein